MSTICPAPGPTGVFFNVIDSHEGCAGVEIRSGSGSGNQNPPEVFDDEGSFFGPSSKWSFWGLIPHYQ